MRHTRCVLLELAALLWTARLVQGQDVAVTTQEPLDYNSCQWRCVEEYFPGHPCYCNSNCQQYENCCEDYYAQCYAEFVWSDEWSEFNGHGYKFFSDLQVTYQPAKDACRGHGGLLVSINSVEEAEFVRDSVLRRRTLSAFIGGSDTSKEGEWIWVDGTMMTSPTDSWHFWFPGQPDDADDSEDCAIMTNYMFWAQRKRTLDDYVWLDYNCAINNREIQGYICETTLACEPNPCQNGGSCYYVGAAEDFRCECTSGFYGLRCDIELADGQMWTVCGDTELTGSSGVVTSPLFPRDYPPNVRCQWAINVGEGKTISLSIEVLDLETSKDCFFDSLTITDGDSNSGARLVGPVCGDLSGNSTDRSLMQPLTTSGSKALIDFRTDSSTSAGGFRLAYKADRCGRGAGDSGCGVPRTFETDCGRTEFTRGPAEGATCQFDIQIQTGNVINLTFTEFNIPDSGPGCTGGAMVVYNGAVGLTSVVARACGHRFPWSVISTSNRLYLRLQDVTWDNSIHKVAFQYASIDVSEWRGVAAPVVKNADRTSVGSLSASNTPVNVETGDSKLYTWFIRCRVGDRLFFNWTLFSSANAELQIYDGHSIYSRLVTSQISTNKAMAGQLTSTTFQILVKVTSKMNDSNFRFDASYQAKDWTPKLSGCYRPLYSSSTDSLSTENSVVLPDQPVVVMASDAAYQAPDAGYDAGLYCKWTIRGSAGERLKLKFLDFDVPPNDPDCSSDGLVVYDPIAQTQKARLCGASPSVLDETLVSASDVMELYFYSDTRGSRRIGGILRAILTTAAETSCDFLLMETSSNPTLSTSCGVLLSPWFPGMVPPGLWLWTLKPNSDEYFTVNVHYVRGPDLLRECKQYFQIVEVPADSTTLKQYESRMLRLCEDTDLFIPEYSLKNPPRQKLGIELNTIKRSVFQRWEFKISYSSSRIKKPPFTNAPPEACPTDYSYYRGNCYLYEAWVKRHYLPEEYKYQVTWQASSDRCHRDNATLITIKDEEEADFIRYQFSSEWFWDFAAPSQINHRTIFLGLTNREEDYVWRDGTQLAYSDWFQPIESWARPILHEDEQEMYDLLGLTSPEPKPDMGSLCTVMIVRSPFDSLNWAKLPCDYPIFRAGLICKKPAATPATAIQVTEPYEVLLKTISEGYIGCRPRWRLMDDVCFRLLTDYAKVIEVTNNRPAPGGLDLNEATSMCAGDGGRLAVMSASAMETIKLYLAIWRHKLNMGNIWLGSSGNLCRAIEVYKTHRLDKEVQYRLVEKPCAEIRDVLRPYSVLCFTDLAMLKEVCTAEEFRCNNGVCISVDFVCDGHNDCFDNSDEMACQADTCDMDKFRCDNGQCISMSLFCDKVDNCVDGSDEAMCVREMCEPGQFRCASGECILQSVVCDFRRNCNDGSDESDETCLGECRGFQCFSGLCLPASMQHDVISDCPGVALEDEIDKSRDVPTLFDVLDDVVSVDITNKSYLGCPEADSSQCMIGYDRCFRRSDTCVFDTLVADERERKRILASCREGSHLRTKCGELECPGLFKCPSSYCVPYSKVCDGLNDCIRGEDEDQCDNYICPGLFHCKGESYCVPHSMVCDGLIQCVKYREDEKYCGIIDILCVDSCRCDGNVAICFNMTALPVDVGNTTRTLRSIIVSESKLSIRNDSFLGLHWLGKLDLSNSGITELPADVFKDLTNLFELDLSGNDITSLDPGVFNGLVSLRVLNLHNNQLDFIDRDTFSQLSALKHLIITKNPLTDVTQDAFSKVPTLTILNSDAFKFCCIAKHVETCTPQADEFSSCEDLMANYPLQVSIWILGFFAFAGNIFVVIWRIKTDRSKVSSFLIINLGCSDFFMGVYMLIIASVDNYYRGQYIVYAEKWRSSALCQLAGILATLSSEVSVFMLTVITADRLYVILFPLKTKIRLSQARYVVTGGWCVCFILAIVPVLGFPYFGDAFFGRTGVCLPFQLNNEQLAGWEYSIAIFLVLNFISFVFIFIAYVIIFAKVKAAAKKMGDKATSTTDDISLAKKLMLIVATDLLCWVPIIMIGFVGLGGTRIPGQVSAWIAVFVLPLNSAVNPILYTMSAIDCSSKRKKRKRPAISASSTMATGVSETSAGQSTMQMKPNGNSV